MTHFLVHLVCFINLVIPDRHKYTALLEIDELIIPIKHANWMDMMDEVEEQMMDKKEEVANWNSRNVYFLENMRDLRDPQPKGTSLQASKVSQLETTTDPPT